MSNENLDLRAPTPDVYGKYTPTQGLQPFVHVQLQGKSYIYCGVTPIPFSFSSSEHYEVIILEVLEPVYTSVYRVLGCAALTIALPVTPSIRPVHFVPPTRFSNGNSFTNNEPLGHLLVRVVRSNASYTNSSIHINVGDSQQHTIAAKKGTQQTFSFPLKVGCLLGFMQIHKESVWERRGLSVLQSALDECFPSFSLEVRTGSGSTMCSAVIPPHHIAKGGVFRIVCDELHSQRAEARSPADVETITPIGGNGDTCVSNASHTTSSTVESLCDSESVLLLDVCAMGWTPVCTSDIPSKGEVQTASAPILSEMRSPRHQFRLYNEGMPNSARSLSTIYSMSDGSSPTMSVGDSSVPSPLFSTAPSPFPTSIPPSNAPIPMAIPQLSSLPIPSCLKQSLNSKHNRNRRQTAPQPVIGGLIDDITEEGGNSSRTGTSMRTINSGCCSNREGEGCVTWEDARAGASTLTISTLTSTECMEEDRDTATFGGLEGSTVVVPSETILRQAGQDQNRSVIVSPITEDSFSLSPSTFATTRDSIATLAAKQDARIQRRTADSTSSSSDEEMQVHTIPVGGVNSSRGSKSRDRGRVGRTEARNLIQSPSRRTVPTKTDLLTENRALLTANETLQATTTEQSESIARLEEDLHTIQQYCRKIERQHDKLLHTCESDREEYERKISKYKQQIQALLVSQYQQNHPTTPSNSFPRTLDSNGPTPSEGFVAIRHQSYPLTCSTQKLRGVNNGITRAPQQERFTADSSQSPLKAVQQATREVDNKSSSPTVSVSTLSATISENKTQSTVASTPPVGESIPIKDTQNAVTASNEVVIPVVNIPKRKASGDLPNTKREPRRKAQSGGALGQRPAYDSSTSVLMPEFHVANQTIERVRQKRLTELCDNLTILLANKASIVDASSTTEERKLTEKQWAEIFMEYTADVVTLTRQMDQERANMYETLLKCREASSPNYGNSGFSTFRTMNTIPSTCTNPHSLSPLSQHYPAPDPCWDFVNTRNLAATPSPSYSSRSASPGEYNAVALAKHKRQSRQLKEAARELSHELDNLKSNTDGALEAMSAMPLFLDTLKSPKDPAISKSVNTTTASMHNSVHSGHASPAYSIASHVIRTAVQQTKDLVMNLDTTSSPTTAAQQTSPTTTANITVQSQQFDDSVLTPPRPTRNEDSAQNSCMSNSKTVQEPIQRLSQTTQQTPPSTSQNTSCNSSRTTSPTKFVTRRSSVCSIGEKATRSLRCSLLDLDYPPVEPGSLSQQQQHPKQWGVSNTPPKPHTRKQSIHDTSKHSNAANPGSKLKSPPRQHMHSNNAYHHTSTTTNSKSRSTLCDIDLDPSTTDNYRQKILSKEVGKSNKIPTVLPDSPAQHSPTAYDSSRSASSVTTTTTVTSSSTLITGDNSVVAEAHSCIAETVSASPRTPVRMDVTSSSFLPSPLSMTSIQLTEIRPPEPVSPPPHLRHPTHAKHKVRTFGDIPQADISGTSSHSLGLHSNKSRM